LYKSIFRDTFASVFENKDALFKALLIPTVFLIFCHFFLMDISKQFAEGTVDYYTVVPTFLLSLVINLIIAITTHRILLLGSDSVPKWGSFKFSSREISFAYNFILLVLIYFILTLILILVSFLLFFIINTIFTLEMQLQNAVFLLFPIVIVSISILCGLALVFPSAATDNKLSFKQAWKLTKGYRVLCFVAIIIFPNIFGAIFGFVYGLAIEFLVNLISENLNVLYPILNVLISIFTISALSHTYKYIIANSPNIDGVLTNNESNKISKLSINDLDIIELDSNHEITFESLKDELVAQYEKLGYINAVVDEIDSWVVKQQEDGDSYVALRVTSDEYQIQTFNVDEPILRILKNNDSPSEV